MAPAGKMSGFHREGNAWFSNSSLPSDITVVVEEVNFHLHKFPLISRCGKISTDLEQSQTITDNTPTLTLQDFPGGPDIFFTVVKFCYNNRIKFTPRNIVVIYCAADYLKMTDEDNLLYNCECYFQKHTLRQWKDCILSLQSCQLIIPRADKLQIVNRCVNALSVMICTDPTLFGWPMMMYGSFQSPGGSILWNGINTGAKINARDRNESDWWFEDVSYLCVELFERLMLTMETKGIKPENFTRVIIYYCRKHLPGLGRWQAEHHQQSGVLLSQTVTSFTMKKPVCADQIVLLKSAVKLLPEKLKGESFCRFLLGLLRVALILGVDRECLDSLERIIGLQLEFAILDDLLIPSYSDSDVLYDSDCLERMVGHFVSSETDLAMGSAGSSVDFETSLGSGRLRRVGRLVDEYLAEIASDVNLKPEMMRSLAERLPEASRRLHDGLYRALDIYLKAHPWLVDKERENLCNVIDFQKLSLEACAHATQNQRLPLRIILQVLFFEQMQLRTSLAGCLNIMDTESAPAPGQRAQREGWVTVVRENQDLKGDMERMRSRVGELEQEFGKIKEEMKKVTKANSYLDSPRLIGRKLLPRPSDAKLDILGSTASTPITSVRQSQSSIRLPWHRRGYSFFG